MNNNLNHLKNLVNCFQQQMADLQCNLNNFKDKSEQILNLFEQKFCLFDNDNNMTLHAYDSFLKSLLNLMDLSRKFSLDLHLNDFEKNENRNFFQQLQRQYSVNDRLQATTEDEKTCIENKKIFSCSQSLSNFQEKAKLSISDNFNNLPHSNETPISSDHKHSQDINEKPIKEVINVKNELKIENNVGLTKDLININNSLHMNESTMLPIEKNPNDNKIQHYEGIPNDLNKSYEKVDYRIGDKISASITYIEDFYTFSFCIFDHNYKNMSILQNGLNKLSKRDYGLPPQNQLFGLEIDDTVVRAIRNNFSKGIDEREKPNRHVYLIDYGVVVEFFDNYITYFPPPEWKTLPPQSLFCQLMPKNGQSIEELQKILKQKFDVLNFVIVDIKNDKLFLELCSPPKEASGEKLVTNFFEIKTSYKLIKTKKSQNLTKTKKSQKLTQAELDELYDEPLSTTNAMQAVMGYVPKDDKCICSFYDEKTGGCFKGANCNLKHMPLMEDGWTKDTEVVKNLLNNFEIPVTVYKEGSSINITITYFHSIEYFYATINDSHFPTLPFVWNEDEVTKWYQQKKPPLLMDLVLAKYEDNLWYRARIVDFDAKCNIFKVFFVDYGNEILVTLSNIAYCSTQKCALPFQALMFRFYGIYSVVKTQNDEDKAITILQNQLLNQTFDVQVMSNHEDLIVDFGNNDKYNMTKMVMSSLKYIK